MDLAAAFAACPRARFLPPGQQPYAGLDRALPLGYDVTCSQPTTVRRMLELLGPRPGDRVLDVGCGSGWTTALLAHLVGPAGRVVGVEIIPEVLAAGTRHLAGLTGLTGLARVELHLTAPGAPLGWPAGAPYDRILVSADAPVLAPDLVAQLVPGGVLVGPVRGEMLRVERHGRYVFVPLRTLDP